MSNQLAALTVIRTDVRDQILAHVEATPARESCGALFGRDGDGDGDGARRIEQAVPVRNEAEDLWRGYFIPADHVRRLEHDAAEAGLLLVGFYHSHPDGGLTPSPSDLRHAWPWYTYLIVSPHPGAERISAWRLHADRRGFESEPIEWQ